MNMYKYNVYTYIYIMYVYMYNSITDTLLPKINFATTIFLSTQRLVEKDQIRNII